MSIKAQTLMVAIQCVNTEIKRLDALLNQDEVDNPEEIEQLLLSFDLAAADLKESYEAALEKFGELPPYADLIK
ncbi:hypothetical protein V8J88_09490 [Massilia sp. W12]|uniref:hypothetical protein n=1 Tax=Massilia sp. W12 TaxID=3126507 RepID=UPI0030D03C3D